MALYSTEGVFAYLLKCQLTVMNVIHVHYTKQI